MPKTPEFHWAPPLDPTPIYNPLASLALLYLIVNTLAPLPTLMKKNRCQGLRNM